MDLVDAHLHLDDVSWKSLQEMSMAGIKTVIAPVQLMAGKAVSPETIKDVWDFLFELQFLRAEKNFIKAYGMIGISMVSTPRDSVEALYELLPQYLSRPEVVAIGEIGVEPGSRTCTDLKQQEEYVVRQLPIAKEAGVCVDFHTPNAAEPKKEWTRRMIELCREADMPMDKVIFDHCTDANLGDVLESGAWAAISVQPWRPVTPEMAANFIGEFGVDRIMIDSDCGPMASDPLAVAKTAFAMKQAGFAYADIEKVCGQNCRAAYGI